MLGKPCTILMPMVFVPSIAGGCAATRDMFDIWRIVIPGLGALGLRRFGIPLPPAVLATMIGPLAAPTPRRSLLLSAGDPSGFVSRPMAGPITVVAIVLILLPAPKMLHRSGATGPREARRADRAHP